MYVVLFLIIFNVVIILVVCIVVVIFSYINIIYTASYLVCAKVYTLFVRKISLVGVAEPL